MYKRSSREGALRQGEILEDVPQLIPLSLDYVANPNNLEFAGLKHPFSVIITQDCDLDLDFEARRKKTSLQHPEAKHLNCVLLCEMQVEDFYKIKGTREKYGITRDILSSIKRYNMERYHHLPEFELQEELGLSSIILRSFIIDFKRFFSVPVVHLYGLIEANSVTRIVYLDSPFKEHLSQRFYNYQSRIALPEVQ